jgi:hypothetical protein
LCTGVLVSATVSIWHVGLDDAIYLFLYQVNEALVLLDLDYLILTLLFCAHRCGCNPWDTVLYFNQPVDRELECTHYIHSSFSTYISSTAPRSFHPKLSFDTRTGSRDYGPDKRLCLRYPSMAHSSLPLIFSPLLFTSSLSYRIGLQSIIYKQSLSLSLTVTVTATAIDLQKVSWSMRTFHDTSWCALPLGFLGACLEPYLIPGTVSTVLFSSQSFTHS